MAVSIFAFDMDGVLVVEDEEDVFPGVEVRL